MARPRKTDAAEPTPKPSLVDQARALSIRDGSGITPAYRREAEVFIAWIMGEVDTSAVAKVLNLTHTSAIAQKAGTVLRNCGMAKAIRISWIEDDDGKD